MSSTTYKGYKGYKAIILRHLDKHNTQWFKSHELQQRELSSGWVGSRGSRDCRDLAEKGLIKVRHDGKYAEYSSIENKPLIETKTQVDRDEFGNIIRVREVLA